MTVTEFMGPTSEDFANVGALNKAFLKVTSDLPQHRLQRLAAAPFLLFSLREDDDEWWYKALNDDPQQDLVLTGATAPAELQMLQTAGLGFLWELARRNPYAARIVSGATVGWCENLSAQTLVVLLDRVAARGDLMTSRLENHQCIWSRLLGNGSCAEQSVRRSSQLSAMHTLLTRARGVQYARMPAAACRMPAVNRQVADRVKVRQRQK